MKEKDLYIRIGKNITRLTVQSLPDECEMEESNLIPIEKRQAKHYAINPSKNREYYRNKYKDFIYQVTVNRRKR